VGFDPKNPVLHGPNFGNSLAQINHYALRSKQSFLVKSERGLPNRGHVPVDAHYWMRRNFNGETDSSLAKRSYFYSALAVAGDTVVPEDAEIKKLYAALGAVFGKKT